VPSLDFLVRRSDIRDRRFAHASEPELRPGQVLLRVDRFGFSANNVTYAALGETMRYWDFFPAPDGWGKLPVWGYADVVRSECGGVTEDERIFGYLPIATHVVVQPGDLTPARFLDASPHRADLPGVYQRYGRVAADPGHDPAHEDEHAIWRPLFMTSFGAADYLAENDLFGATRVVCSSASSKTALGIAHLLSRSRPSGCLVTGLTSPANAGFCADVGYYDEVLTYAELDSLPRDRQVLFVDLAGDDGLRRRLSEHLGDGLAQTCVIGATHWQRRRGGTPLGGGDSRFFFLPPWIEKRRADWGAGGFARAYDEAWGAFQRTTTWMRIVHGRGPEAIDAVYAELVEGNVDPRVGHMLSLDE